MNKTPDRCPDHKKTIDDLSRKIEEQGKIMRFRKRYLVRNMTVLTCMLGFLDT